MRRTRSLKLALTALLLPACLSALGVTGSARPRGDEDLIGLAAPPLRLRHWLNSPPLETNQLKGKVLLVRWWTDSCPFCSTTAPALRQLDSRYRGTGLQVIGIFHPKPPGDWSMERVRQISERFGFTFPVALDADWEALGRWWLSGRDRDWTSVSFLVDKQGIIRYVHPGGEFHEGPGGGHWPDHQTCQQDYRQIEETIERLLAE